MNRSVLQTHSKARQQSHSNAVVLDYGAPQETLEKKLNKAEVLATFFGGRQLETDQEVEARCAGSAAFPQL